MRVQRKYFHHNARTSDHCAPDCADCRRDKVNRKIERARQRKLSRIVRGLSRGLRTVEDFESLPGLTRRKAIWALRELEFAGRVERKGDEYFAVKGIYASTEQVATRGSDRTRY